jgi:hypothetical protein
MKILEESSFVTKFLFYFVFVHTGGSSSGYIKKYFRDTFMGGKKGWETLLQGSTGIVP